jgi:hypothetical protein
MMTVVLNETQKAVEIFMDEKGIDLLVKALTILRTSGDHLHLYTTNNDDGLSNISPYRNEVTFRQLIVTALPPDAWSDQ